MEESVKRTKRVRKPYGYALPIALGFFLIFVGAIFPYTGVLLYQSNNNNNNSALGLADIGIGLAVLALALGIIYHAISQRMMSDRIDRLSRKIDLLLLDPGSPLISRIEDNNRELGELKGGVRRLQTKIVGQDEHSLASDLKAKMAQIRKLLEV